MKQVKMIALRDFPCPNTNGQGVTRQRKGSTFMASIARSKTLAEAGKAKAVDTEKGEEK